MGPRRTISACGKVLYKPRPNNPAPPCKIFHCAIWATTPSRAACAGCCPKTTPTSNTVTKQQQWNRGLKCVAEVGALNYHANRHVRAVPGSRTHFFEELTLVLCVFPCLLICMIDAALMMNANEQSTISIGDQCQFLM